MFSHAKRRPASEPRGDGYEQRGCFSAVLAVPVRQREAHYEHEENGPKTEFWRTRSSFAALRFAPFGLGRPAFSGKVMVYYYEILTRLGPERSRENERIARAII